MCWISGTDNGFAYIPNVDIAPSVENSFNKSLDVTYNIEIEQTPVMQTEEKKISLPISSKVSLPISCRNLNIDSQQSFEEINTKIIQREKQMSFDQNYFKNLNEKYDKI